jgi:hypothetical protein
MPEKIEKRVVTPDDILSALDMGSLYRVLTRPELKKAIVMRVWGVPEVYDARTASWHIKTSAFDQLLAEMADDGRVVMMDGWTLEGLTDRVYVTRTWGYYLLPEQAERLRKESKERDEEKRQAEADAYAKKTLAERYDDEYDDLVKVFYANLKKEQGE